jgi:hypothetical protein
MFKAGAKAWANSLSAAQCAAWDVFASVHPWTNVFGDAITLSGIAMYAAVNQRVALCGGDRIDDPPTSWGVGDLGQLTVSATLAGGLFTALSVVPARALEYYEGLYIMLTPGVSNGRRIQKVDFRLLNDPDVGLFASGENISAIANARFTSNTWIAGRRYSLRVAGMNLYTGCVGAGVYAEQTV